MDIAAIRAELAKDTDLDAAAIRWYGMPFPENEEDQEEWIFSEGIRVLSDQKTAGDYLGSRSGVHAGVHVMGAMVIAQRHTLYQLSNAISVGLRSRTGHGPAVKESFAEAIGACEEFGAALLRLEGAAAMAEANRGPTYVRD